MLNKDKNLKVYYPYRGLSKDIGKRNKIYPFQIYYLIDKKQLCYNTTCDITKINVMPINNKTLPNESNIYIDLNSGYFYSYNGNDYDLIITKLKDETLVLALPLEDYTI